VSVKDVLAAPIVKWLTWRKTRSTMPLSDFQRIREELQACDVILVEGRSRASDVIKLITQSPWSHAALFIGRVAEIDNPELRATVVRHVGAHCDEQLMIESELGLGTVIRPISVYRGEHLRICRPAGLSRSDARTVVAHALSRVGTPYNVRQILDLARFLFPWRILPRRWRSTLFYSRVGLATRTVCSSMIAEAFDAAGFPILPLVKRLEGNTVRLFRRNPMLCTPKDFDYSPYFEIIKRPFLDLSSYASFCLVPWQTEIIALSAGPDLSKSQVGVYLPHTEVTPDGALAPQARNVSDDLQRS
jgi:hypothetical protein